MSQQSLRGSASVALRAKATENVAPGASCTLTPEGLPPYDKGRTTAKAARWILSEVEVGYRKKGVKEQSFLVLFPCSLRNVEIAIQFPMWNDTCSQKSCKKAQLAQKYLY
jgi:hypothetical protein